MTQVAIYERQCSVEPLSIAHGTVLLLSFKKQKEKIIQKNLVKNLFSICTIAVFVSFSVAEKEWPKKRRYTKYRTILFRVIFVWIGEKKCQLLANNEK